MACFTKKQDRQVTVDGAWWVYFCRGIGITREKDYPVTQSISLHTRQQRSFYGMLQACELFLDGRDPPGSCLGWASNNGTS